MKRMFVIYGQMNSGKTHTMWLVLNRLLNAGAEILYFSPHRHQFTREEVLAHPEPIGDFSALLEIDGERYAIWSAGDYLNYFEEKIEWAKDNNADYVICTARSVNRGNSVYCKLMDDYRGNVLDDNDWFWVDIDKSRDWLLKRDSLARRIAYRIYSNMNTVMRRTIWPVGHGAFYTETFNEYADNVSVVYDCGGIKNQVDNCVRLFTQENAIGAQKPVVRYLFISHFHQDHINGIPELLQKATVQNIIIPQLGHEAYVEAFMQNLTKLSHTEVADDATLNLLMHFATGEGIEGNIVQVQIGEGKLREPAHIEIDERGHIHANVVSSGQEIRISDLRLPHRFWHYIPVNVCQSEDDLDKMKKLLTKLKEYTPGIQVNAPLMGGDGKINFDVLRQIASDEEELKKLKKIYNGIFGENDNVYSMPVYSGPIHFPFYRGAEICYNSAMCDGHSIAEVFASDYYAKLEQKAVACLYMGDFVCKRKLTRNDKKTKLDILKEVLDRYWYRVGMLQIPHHASIDNHSLQLYRKSKICFANINDHGDISFTHSVIRDVVKENCIPYVVTENDERLEIWIK